jgi:arylsulfatase A-like enzyme
MVTRLDRDIGQLLDLLAELGLEGRTLVMTAGDNGSSFDPDSEIGRLFNQASNGLRGYKRGLYEGALRQAALARWPGVIPAGRVTDEPWAFWDFLPTAAELAGVRLPADHRTDGRSLVEFLRGGPAPRREFFYWELHEQRPLQAARFGDWKAVRNGHDQPLELYDLARDPGERANLAATRPDLVARAEGILRSEHTPDPRWPLDRRSPERQSPAGKQKAKGAK